MLILGLVFIIASAALGTAVALNGSDSATLSALGTTLDTTVAGIFFAGAAAMLVFVLGVWMLTSASSRSRRKRAERKELRRRHKASVSALEDERTQLRAENERLHERLGHDDGAATGATMGDRTMDGDRTTGDRTMGDDRTSVMSRGTRTRDADMDGDGRSTSDTAGTGERLDHNSDLGADGADDSRSVDVRRHESSRRT